MASRKTTSEDSRRKPIPLDRVLVRGRAEPASCAAIAKAFATELPPSYVDVMTRWGVGSFARTLELPPPSWVVRWTKAFQKKWTDPVGRVFFTDYEEKLGGGRGMRLIDIGRGPAGDRLCFAAGEPGALYVLPRSQNNITVVSDMAGAFGWFFASARNVDPNVEARYVVAR